MNYEIQELLKVAEQVLDGKREVSDLPEEVIVYHGTRSHMGMEEIKKYGICAWESPGGAVNTVLEALRELGINPASDIYSGAAIRTCDWAASPQLSLTSYKDAACAWARNAPELVSFPALLSEEAQNAEKVMEYLEENFGKAYRLTVKWKPTKGNLYALQDIHSGMKCITPEMILDVEECNCK